MMPTGMFRNSARFTQSYSSIYLRNLGLRFSSTTIKHGQPPKPPTGVKKLIQQYGYSALGIYLGISLIDLPICFLVVHSAGEEKIRELQDKFLTWIGYKNSAGPTNTDEGLDTTTNKEREEEKSSTLVTEFALAYAIHKSLIFVRLPLTAAITPWVVARLQRWGFKVGKAAIVKTAAKGKKFDPTGKSAKFD